MALDFVGIAKQFVEHYYTTFDNDRAALRPLYRENSMLTFQEAQNLGVNDIIQKLSSLPFQKVKHVIVSLVAQPSPSNGILIQVSGHLAVDDSPQPLPYSQTFHLAQDASGQWFVSNDIFSLTSVA